MAPWLHRKQGRQGEKTYVGVEDDAKTPDGARYGRSSPFKEPQGAFATLSSRCTVRERERVDTLLEQAAAVRAFGLKITIVKRVDRTVFEEDDVRQRLAF